MRLRIHQVALCVYPLLTTLGCHATDELWEVAGERGPPAQKHRPKSAAARRVEEVWQRSVEQGYSGVALVRHRGKVLGHFSAGLRDRERGLPNAQDSLFDIGSITKQFTGAAIMRLHERGELDLQAALGELLEGVPADKADITVHQLLTHTAGFPSAIGYDDEAIEREAYLERAWRQPLVFDPGTLHWYSNTGYSILGAVIERLTGEPYDAYLARELLRPAGLDETGYIGLDVEPDRIAVGYSAEGDADFPLERPHAEDGYYWNLRANGGLLSTTGDLARWSDALLGGEVLGPEALETYLTPHVREGLGSDGFYAYGWAIRETEVGRLVVHNGGNGYFLADVRQYVDADLLVVTLSNEENEASLRLSFDLADAVLPALPSSDELPEPEPLALERFEILEGTTASFVETLEFPPEREAAVAGFALTLFEGRGRYRLVSPSGEVVAEGDAESPALTERLVPIAPEVGEWRLEVDVEDATGDVFMAWLWE